MNKRLILVACLLGACSRSEPTTSAPVPLHSASIVGVGVGVAADAGPVRAVGPASASSASSDSVAGSASAVAPATGGGRESSPAASALPRGTKRSTTAVGYTSGLRLESDAATYCDDRGGRALDLVTGKDTAHERQCVKNEERNSACGGIDFVVDVREPDVDDIIDVKDGPSFPVNGHIHDCVFDSGTLLVATGLEVVAFDVKADHRVVKRKDAGDQVAIDAAWMAWSAGGKVFVERR